MLICAQLLPVTNKNQLSWGLIARNTVLLLCKVAWIDFVKFTKIFISFQIQKRKVYFIIFLVSISSLVLIACLWQIAIRVQLHQNRSSQDHLVSIKLVAIEPQSQNQKTLVCQVLLEFIDSYARGCKFNKSQKTKKGGGFGLITFLFWIAFLVMRFPQLLWKLLIKTDKITWAAVTLEHFDSVLTSVPTVQTWFCAGRTVRAAASQRDGC